MQLEEVKGKQRRQRDQDNSDERLRPCGRMHCSVHGFRSTAWSTLGIRTDITLRTDDQGDADGQQSLVEEYKVSTSRLHADGAL